MTPTHPTPESASRQDPSHWSRSDRCAACHDFFDPDHPSSSQRDFARRHGIPHSTFNDWLRPWRDCHDGTEPQLVAFLLSPAGERFLHRIVGAALLVLQQAGTAGIRSVGLFLRLAALEGFVGSSYGALYPRAKEMERLLGAFDDEERPRLAATMGPGDITLCADENFHGPQGCLVAIEPASNFILLERFAPRRDGATWTAAIEQALAGLPVRVVLLCSDRATGLIRCARDGLRVLHQPELFHLLRDLLRPLLLPLARPVQQAQKELRDARAETARLEEACQQSLARPRRRGRPVDYFDRMLESVRTEMMASQQIEESQEKLDGVLGCARGLADDYHPFDAQTGQPVTAEQVEQRLHRRMGQLRQAAEQAGLAEQGQQAQAEAQGWVEALAATVAWFWLSVQQRLERLDLPEPARQWLCEHVVSGSYWQAAARRARAAPERRRLKELAEALLAKGWSAQGPLASLPAAQQAELGRVARQCAGLFSRSSSCVEGRNGRLSLQHHGKCGLSAARLKALGVIHNYLSQREDATTAAERFFGSKPRDLFAWLLQRMPELPRPAARRTRKEVPAMPLAG
jgi:hypothetical protein